MHFVHIIEINDTRALLAPLTREQLWRGLKRRAERPMEFLPQLLGCLIVMRDDATLVRELDFGTFIVRDRVRLAAPRQLSIDTEPAPNISAGRLTIEIEEPGHDQLQLRFTYDIERERTDDVASEAKYDRFLQSAYVAADIDSVKTIRRLVDTGSV